jgi:hypothetical protein
MKALTEWAENERRIRELQRDLLATFPGVMPRNRRNPVKDFMMNLVIMVVLGTRRIW